MQGRLEISSRTIASVVEDACKHREHQLGDVELLEDVDQPSTLGVQAVNVADDRQQRTELHREDFGEYGARKEQRCLPVGECWACGPCAAHGAYLRLVGM